MTTLWMASSHPSHATADRQPIIGGGRVHDTVHDAAAQVTTLINFGTQDNDGYAADLHRDLPTSTLSQLRSRPPTRWSCTASRPISTRLEPVPRLRSFTTDSSRIPSDLACRTRTIWQYWHVPALSALLPALSGVPRIRLRPAPTRLLRQPSEEVFHILRSPAPHGARFPCSARARPGWVGCPLYPGDDGVHTTVARSSVAACRLTTAWPLQPWCSYPPQSLRAKFFGEADGWHR